MTIILGILLFVSLAANVGLIAVAYLYDDQLYKREQKHRFLLVKYKRLLTKYNTVKRQPRITRTSGDCLTISEMPPLTTGMVIVSEKPHQQFIDAMRNKNRR